MERSTPHRARGQSVARRAACRWCRILLFSAIVGAVFAMVIASAGSALAGVARAGSAPAVGAPTVVEIPIEGVVDPLVARMVKRELRAAADQDAAAVIIRIDTPGGLDSSMRSIIKAIQASPIPVICWTGPAGARAASAGAFIMIGCPFAAMAPGTNIGAAHPVGLRGEVLTDKVTNDAAAYIRSLAQARGRNSVWAERAVRESVSLSAVEAEGEDVIDAVVADRTALLRAVDGREIATSTGVVVAHVSGARIEKRHLNWGERLLHDLVSPDLAFLLLVLGLAGLVFEITHPGLNIPGVLGLLMVIASVVIVGMLPVNIAGVLLLVAAFVFFVIDAQVAGHGLPTVAGFTCLIFGGLFLFDTSVPSAQVTRWVIAVVAITMAPLLFVAMRAARRARALGPISGAEALIGMPAEVTVEIPASGTGEVRVRGERWTARLAVPQSDAADGEPLVGSIAAGSTVTVIGRSGLVLEVVPRSGDEVADVGDTGTFEQLGRK